METPTGSPLDLLHYHSEAGCFAVPCNEPEPHPVTGGGARLNRRGRSVKSLRRYLQAESQPPNLIVRAFGEHRALTTKPVSPSGETLQLRINRLTSFDLALCICRAITCIAFHRMPLPPPLRMTAGK